MKLPTGDGAYIEAREVIQYSILADRIFVRHDTAAGGEQLTASDPKGAVDATAEREVKRAQLDDERIRSGAILAEAIRKLGKDYSEAEALPMPAGLSAPDWAK